MSKTKLKGCIPMDKEWKETISENKWWATGYDLNKIGGIKEINKPENEMIKKLLSLREILLKDYGGEEVCLPAHDQDIDKILNRGLLFVINDENKDVGQLVHYDEIIGLPSQCHRNSCYLYKCEEIQAEYEYAVKIMTGYALSSDGMWRQHSWCICDIGEDYIEDSIIIETTEERIAYFGFIMNEDECQEFCESCLF